MRKPRSRELRYRVQGNSDSTCAAGVQFLALFLTTDANRHREWGAVEGGPEVTLLVTASLSWIWTTREGSVYRRTGSPR